MNAPATKASQAEPHAASRRSGRNSLRLPTDPWTLAGIVCLFAGIVLLVVAWYDISGTANLYQQMPYLVSAGFSGLGFIIAGSALLVAGRNDRVERRLAQLLDAVTESIEPAEESAPTPSEPAGMPTDAFFLTAGGQTYHRANCLLLHDKETQAITAGELVQRRSADGLKPCPVCDPPQPEATKSS